MNADKDKRGGKDLDEGSSVSVLSFPIRAIRVIRGGLCWLWRQDATTTEEAPAALAL
jgi:hypothetical protein